MNPDNMALAATILKNTTYITQAQAAKAAQEKKIKTLLSSRSLPVEGWENTTIEMFINELSLMDTNNFIGNVGVGEREGRVFSSLVSQRHKGLSHGIGRSGDIFAVQPKAAGSSLLLKLATFLTLHSLKLAGLVETKECLILPVATGMAHVMTLLTLKQDRPNAKYVIWPRIDQKTCFKAMVTAGLIPIVIDNVLEGDEVRTDMQKIHAEIERVGAENVLCVLSTSSCFAPRTPDRVVEIARTCKDKGIPHVINNAYGVQCKLSCKLVSRAARVGRVDAFIQSTDKNYMVPVGGAIVASVGWKKGFIDEISKTYPGRASMSPILDLFITLLSMGQSGWLRLLREREERMVYFQKKVQETAEELGERYLVTPNNPVSLAMTIDTFGMLTRKEIKTQSTPHHHHHRHHQQKNKKHNTQEGMQKKENKKENRKENEKESVEKSSSGSDDNSDGTSDNDNIDRKLCSDGNNTDKKEKEETNDSCSSGNGDNCANNDAGEQIAKKAGQKISTEGSRNDSSTDTNDVESHTHNTNETININTTRNTINTKINNTNSTKTQHTNNTKTTHAGSHVGAKQYTHSYSHSYFGAMLFQRNVSGPRTVQRNTEKSILGYTFQGYGSHIADYKHHYLTLACAIGMQREEIDVFFQRFKGVVKAFRKQQKKNEKRFAESVRVAEE